MNIAEEFRTKLFQVSGKLPMVASTVNKRSWSIQTYKLSFLAVLNNAYLYTTYTYMHTVAGSTFESYIHMCNTCTTHT